MYSPNVTSAKIQFQSQNSSKHQKSEHDVPKPIKVRKPGRRDAGKKRRGKADTADRRESIMMGTMCRDRQLASRSLSCRSFHLKATLWHSHLATGSAYLEFCGLFSPSAVFFTLVRSSLDLLKALTLPHKIRDQKIWAVQSLCLEIGSNRDRRDWIFWPCRRSTMPSASPKTARPTV